MSLTAKLTANASSDKSENPTYTLHRRYLKDSSFENPGAPMNASLDAPSIDLAVKIVAHQGNDLYEIELNYRITATHEQQITFQIELCFAGLFEMTGASSEQRSRFIYVEAPHILYPHAAKIAADLARDGGLPDLEIAEPDFMTIWKARGTGLLDPHLTLPEKTYASVFALPD